MYMYILNLFTLKTIQHSDLIETLYFEEVRRFIEYRKRNQQKNLIVPELGLF